jgi:hypothetical protein
MKGTIRTQGNAIRTMEGTIKNLQTDNVAKDKRIAELERLLGGKNA